MRAQNTPRNSPEFAQSTDFPREFVKSAPGTVCLRRRRLRKLGVRVTGIRVRKLTMRLAVLACAAMLAACASPHPPAPAPQPAIAQPIIVGTPQPTFAQSGTASWYGASHNGRKTASGETFDMNAPTAAHRSLRFNTIARVTNLTNGRTTWVRINDRGPYAGDRVIDLSARAAGDLDMQRAGLASVRIECFDSDQPFGISER
jgi:rare lipoprotein A (peptidoglycan hydrolase)